jgi:hypothetical protein
VSEYVAVLSAGFEGAEAARIYRALADFALSWAGGEAGFLSLDAHSQEADRAAWTRAYRAVEQTEHPRIWQVWEEPPNVRDDEIFEAILSLVAGGLAPAGPGPVRLRRARTDVSTGLTAGSAGTVLPLDGAGQRGHAVSRATLLICWKE